MSPDRSKVEKRAGFFPNPNEVVPPHTTEDAIEDTLRYAATFQTRAEVIENMRGLDPVRIVLAVQGIIIKPRLNGLELFMANTIDGCIRAGILKNPTEALFALVNVKLDVLDGGVFVGQERIPNQK